MADFPLRGGTGISLAGWIAPYSGTTITNGAANVKGAYSELLSATNNTSDTVSFQLVVINVSSPNSHFIDISIGGAGFEEVIVSNIFVGGYDSRYIRLDLPISIPSGSRVSCRSQGSNSAQVEVYLRLLSGSFVSTTPLSELVSIGDNEASTSGVQISSAGVDTFSAWAEVAAVTDDVYNELISIGFRNTGSWASATINHQIAVGAAGFEEVISDGNWNANTTSETGAYFISSNKITIPKGERLSIRQINSVSNTDLDFQYILYGVK